MANLAIAEDIDNRTHSEKVSDYHADTIWAVLRCLGAASTSRLAHVTGLTNCTVKVACARIAGIEYTPAEQWVLSDADMSDMQ